MKNQIEEIKNEYLDKNIEEFECSKKGAAIAYYRINKEQEIISKYGELEVIYDDSKFVSKEEILEKYEENTNKIVIASYTKLSEEDENFQLSNELKNLRTYNIEFEEGRFIHNFEDGIIMDFYKEVLDKTLDKFLKRTSKSKSCETCGSTIISEFFIKSHSDENGELSSYSCPVCLDEHFIIRKEDIDKVLERTKKEIKKEIKQIEETIAKSLKDNEEDLIFVYTTPVEDENSEGEIE